MTSDERKRQAFGDELLAARVKICDLEGREYP